MPLYNPQTLQTVTEAGSTSNQFISLLNAIAAQPALRLDVTTSAGAGNNLELYVDGVLQCSYGVFSGVFHGFAAPTDIFFGRSDASAYILITAGTCSIGGTVVCGTISAGAVSCSSLTDSGLTSGRVVIAGASGVLADDADLTFSGDTLTATKAQVKAGNSSSNAKVAGSIFDHFTDAANGTTVETDLYSDTLPASIFNTNGDKVYAQYAGIFVGDATSTQRLRAYFGGTLIFDTGALGIGITTANWELNITCIRVSSTVVRCSVTLNTSFATLNSYATYTEVTALTLTNTQILKITGQAAGATGASNQITAKESYGTWLPAA